MSKPKNHQFHLLRAIKECGSLLALARRAEVWPNRITHSLKPDSQISADLAIAIEEATEGKVSRCDLRPDYWPRERWS